MRHTRGQILDLIIKEIRDLSDDLGLTVPLSYNVTTDLGFDDIMIAELIKTLERLFRIDIALDLFIEDGVRTVGELVDLVVEIESSYA